MPKAGKFSAYNAVLRRMPLAINLAREELKKYSLMCDPKEEKRALLRNKRKNGRSH